LMAVKNFKFLMNPERFFISPSTLSRIEQSSYFLDIF